MKFLRPMAMAGVLLALGVGGAARAIETEAFEARVLEVAAGEDRAAALRALEALDAEALQAGRLDLRVHVTAMQARVRLKSGDFSRVRQDLEEARAEARAGGWAVLEALVSEVLADYWLSQGDSVGAADWLEAAWALALAGTPSDRAFAARVLERLAELRTSLGQDHLAARAEAWHAVLIGAPEAPPVEVALQPSAVSTQVAAEEVGRARLMLANATPEVVTGTLLIDGGDLSVAQWDSNASGERVALRFPSAVAAVPHSTAQGRKLTLAPGETRSIELEVEPNTPPRPGRRAVSVSWQAGAVSLAATAEFHFLRARELPATSVATACRVRLNPLVSLPVYMEVYRRGRPFNHVQDLLSVASRPCRVELQEILPDGAAGRRWLAVDADGDGRYFGAGDAVVADADGSGYPDIEFTEGKPVAALEVRVYPLPDADGHLPSVVDLSVSLRDGGRWREPADVSHRIETGR